MTRCCLVGLQWRKNDKSSRQHGTAEVLVRTICYPRTVPQFHKLLSESQEVAREGRIGCLLLTAGGWMGMMLLASFQLAVSEPKGGKGLHMQIPSKKKEILDEQSFLHAELVLSQNW